MRRDEGFTLIEILIASVIGSLVITVVAGIILTAFSSLRAANENFKGDDDVQVVLAALNVDVQASTPALITVSGPGDQLVLGVARPGSGKFVRVTYTYDATAGTLTRSVDDGTVAASVVARNLKQGFTGAIFAFCSSGAGCPSVTATVPYVLSGNEILRTIKVAPRLATP